jgi:hypothetical protein
VNIRVNNGIVEVDICDCNLAKGPFLWPMVGVCKWVDVCGDIGLTQVLVVLYPWRLFPRAAWEIAILLVYVILVKTDQLDMALTIATLKL